MSIRPAFEAENVSVYTSPFTIVRFDSKIGAETPNDRTLRPDRDRDEFALNIPFPVAFDVTTVQGVGATAKVPTSPLKRSDGPVPAFKTLWRPIACSPVLRGAVTHSSARPVTVLKRHRPASMSWFELAPIVDREYGPQMLGARSEKGSDVGPKIRVSRSVGAFDHHVCTRRFSPG